MSRRPLTWMGFIITVMLTTASMLALSRVPQEPAAAAQRPRGPATPLGKRYGNGRHQSKPLLNYTGAKAPAHR